MSTQSTQIGDALVAAGVIPAARTCPTGKKSFGSEELAKAFSAANNQKYGTRLQRAYKCEDCPDYHLTSLSAQEFAMRKVRNSMSSTVTTRRPAGETRARVEEMLAQGMSNQQIAVKLGVTGPTIDYHIRVIEGRYNDNRRRKKSTTGVVASSTPRSFLSLESLAEEKRRLSAELERITKQEQALLEAKRLKVALNGNQVLIEKEGNKLALVLDDAKQLVEELMKLI